MATNTVNQQPIYASLQLTDYLLAWQNGQSPSTRKLTVGGLAAYYASLSGATFTGAVTISSGGLTVTGNTAVTGTFNVSSTVVIASGGMTITAGGLIVTAGGISIAAGGIAATGTSTVPLRGYLSGLTLSNDSGTPNTVLDISAGVCTDSTNTSVISLGAFTKTTGGSWTAGTGNAGMGQGLTIANSTWYHVFAITNNGAADVYFDTSVTAANAPASTTAFRRIGSFKTDGSAHIVAFVQNGDRFDWGTPVNELNSVTPGHTTADTRTLAGVPTGLSVQALLSGVVFDASAASSVLYLSSLAQADVTASSLIGITAITGSASSVGIILATVATNTSAQIRSRVSTATLSLSLNSNGWIDTRGRFS